MLKHREAFSRLPSTCELLLACPMATCEGRGELKSTAKQSQGELYGSYRAITFRERIGESLTQGI